MHLYLQTQFLQAGSKLVLICFILFITSCITENKPVYQLSTSSNPVEGGTVTPAGGEFDEGSELEITATPNGNWMFVEWQGDHSNSQNPDTVIIDSDKSITAMFQIAELSNNQFTGTYSFTQLEPSTSVAGEFSEGWLFNESQAFTAELLLNPASVPNGRIFTASPLPEFGEFETDFPILFEIAEAPENNSVTLGTEVSIELFCEDVSIIHGPATSTNASSFNLSDDSEFTLVIRENSNSQCDLDPQDIAFRVTKIGSTIKSKSSILSSQPANENMNRKKRRVPGFH